MKFAIDADGIKIQAKLGVKGKCPLCDTKMVPKCGEIYKHHWAHKSLKECDWFAENETDWHLGWKWNIHHDCCEVIIELKGKKHIADIVGNNGVVIELQHSPISPQQIRERERFYGSILWLFDATDMEKNLHIRKRDYDYTFRWKYPKKSQWYAKTPFFWDLGHKELVIYRETGTKTVDKWGGGTKEEKEFDEIDLPENHYLFRVDWVSKKVPCGGKGQLITIEDFKTQFLSDVWIEMPSVDWT